MWPRPVEAVVGAALANCAPMMPSPPPPPFALALTGCEHLVSLQEGGAAQQAAAVAGPFYNIGSDHDAMHVDGSNSN